MKIMNLALLALLTLPCFAYANEKGNGGGGEPLFYAMSSDIKTWLIENETNGTLAKKLQLVSISSSELLTQYVNALNKVGSNVKFIPATKLGSECQSGDAIACKIQWSSRTCINVSQPEYKIECNEDLFNARPGDEQFTLVFHEYLGVAGIEENDSEDFSQYPISSKLMKFANPQSVTRWELSEAEVSSTGCTKIDGLLSLTNGTGTMFVRATQGPSKYLRYLIVKKTDLGPTSTFEGASANGGNWMSEQGYETGSQINILGKFKLWQGVNVIDLNCSSR